MGSFFGAAMFMCSIAWLLEEKTKKVCQRDQFVMLWERDIFKPTVFTVIKSGISTFGVWMTYIVLDNTNIFVGIKNIYVKINFLYKVEITQDQDVRQELA